MDSVNDKNAYKYIFIDGIPVISKLLKLELKRLKQNIIKISKKM